MKASFICSLLLFSFKKVCSVKCNGYIYYLAACDHTPCVCQQCHCIHRVSEKCHFQILCLVLSRFPLIASKGGEE